MLEKRNAPNRFRNKTTLASYLMQILKKKNWSQRDLADRAGISNAEVSLLLAGKRSLGRPSVTMGIATAIVGKGDDRPSRTDLALQAWKLMELATQQTNK